MLNALKKSEIFKLESKKNNPNGINFEIVLKISMPNPWFCLFIANGINEKTEIIKLS